MSVFTACNGENKSPKKPNIIMFLVDDMGWQDTSVPFWKEKTPLNQKYTTPGMERLASEGMMFTQAYASSVSSPSRVSLMTGMNPARHRVTNWTLERNASVDGHSDILDYPAWNVNGVQPVDTVPRSTYATLLPQILKDNGYFTIHCGKAHYGAMTTPSADPLNCGFDINIAGHAAGGPGSYLGTENFGNKEKGGHTLPWGVPGLEQYHGDTIFLTEALTREALKALDKARLTEKPFYLNMAHYAVHIPLYADDRYYKKYIDKGLPESEARYASMVEGMDKSLGDLMEYLDRNGMEENTIILFMSDNGGFGLRPRAGELHTHNKPLNSGKGSAYEGGIREPMIVKWPGKVQPGTKCNDYLLIEDFFPTILEMAQVKKYSTVQTVDGRSFVPMLLQNGTTAYNRDLFWHFPNNWGPTGPGIGTTSTIRSGDWKLIYYYEDRHFELFNISEDIGELHDLAGQQPGKVKELAGKLGKYLRSVDAQRPALKGTGELVAWPDEAI
ncbi:MAG: sulfatase [Bacteroidales bacterium]|nr:sulfatase [Bacteroidales bacterium]